MTYPSHVQAQGFVAYYRIGSIQIEIEDVQRVWGTRLRDDTIDLLARYNLLVPIFIDTGIQVGVWVKDAAPIFVAHGSAALIALDPLHLLASQGEYGEGDILDGVEVVTEVSIGEKRVWFAVDADGTLLAAMDGYALYFHILVME